MVHVIKPIQNHAAVLDTTGMIQIAATASMRPQINLSVIATRMSLLSLSSQLLKNIISSFRCLTRVSNVRPHRLEMRLAFIIVIVFCLGS